MLHAKGIVVDELVCVFGSANLDDRSLLLDDEVAVFAADGALSGELTSAFEEDLAESDRVLLDAWQRRPMRHRVLERGALLVRRDL